MLTSYGLSLGRAHAALERLVVDEAVVLDLAGSELEMIDQLKRFGVSATTEVVPAT